ncbi:unnamed protein product [Durusdinium trenchii]
MVLGAELHAEQQLMAELQETVLSRQLQLEALQAQQSWRGIAQQDEQLEWRRKLQELQQRKWQAKEAREAAEQSHEEVRQIVQQDSLSKDLEELQIQTSQLRTHLSEQQTLALEQQTLLEESDSEPLLEELTRLQRQKSAFLEELDALRLGASSEPRARSPSRERGAERRPDGRSERWRQQRMFQQLSQGRERREALRQQLQTQKKEEERLRHQLQDLEQRLQLSRDDAERKRHFVAQLQRSLEAQAEHTAEHADAVPRSRELETELQRAREVLGRKEAALHEWRAEMSEVRSRKEMWNQKGRA